MGMSTRAHIQSLSSIGPILVQIFEVVERWAPVEVWVHDSTLFRDCHLSAGTPLISFIVYHFRRMFTNSRQLEMAEMRTSFAQTLLWH